MKIICVGRNYTAHAKELANEVPSEPVIFLKPDTALLKNNKPFFLPEFSNEVHHEAELVLRVCRNGKHIEEQFARKYFEQITLGIDFTARDVQQQLKEKRVSWELAKAFDNSAPVGRLLAIDQFPDLYNLNFTLLKNGEAVQKGNTRNMIFSAEKLIAFVSRYISLREGDLIFTGTPEGVGPVQINDRLTGFVEQEQVFDFYVK